MQENNNKGIFPSNVIKWAAIITMILDHIAWAFIETESVAGMVCHTFGKITGPVMFFFIAEGYHYTKNLKKYVERLGIFALISEIPYSMFMNRGSLLPLRGNVIVTLLCALCALIVFHECKDLFLKWLLIAILITVTYYTDWSFFGVLITLAFGIFYGNRKNQLIAYAVVNIIKILVTWVQHEGIIYYMVPVIVSPLLVMGLLFLYNGKKGGEKASKWAFYIIYPLHFLIIGAVWLFI